MQRASILSGPLTRQRTSALLSHSQLSLSERVQLANLAAGRFRRSFEARWLSPRLVRLRYGTSVTDTLLLVPREIRTADPSFATELLLGHFGLAGAVAVLDGRSPFRLEPPSDAWAERLHGFGWLRHLAGARNAEARLLAQRLLKEWLALPRREKRIADRPHVMARRVISWITHADLVIGQLERHDFERVSLSLSREIRHLAACWRNASPGYPRLVSVTALMLAHLCLEELERNRKRVERAFIDELESQILPDGGHVSRNAGTLIEVLLDILPLRQCFVGLRQNVPQPLDAAIQRMLPMIRFMRLGDGTLARFNGVGATRHDSFATVLAYADRFVELPTFAESSRYARLVRGNSVVIMDVGGPPPLELAGTAAAGCLSFELSDGDSAILVNGGMPGPVHAQQRPIARATASHNTVTVGETSSAKLVRDAALETHVGAPSLRQLGDVSATLTERPDGDLAIEATHHGYQQDFNLSHTRRLVMSAAGDRVTGQEILGGSRVAQRFAHDMPVAVHFHLHPSVKCDLGIDPQTAVLSLPNGQAWFFRSPVVPISIESSTYFADHAGPRRSLQVVLRTTTYGEAEINWSIERLRRGAMRRT